MSIEKTILKALLKNEEYSRKVLPFIKEEYFQQQEDRIIFSAARDLTLKYNKPPSLDAVFIDIDNKPGLEETVIDKVGDTLKGISEDDTVTTLEWLVDATETFCQDRALHNAIMQSIQIIDPNGMKNGSLSKGALPQLLADALSVSFDPKLGHDYMDDYDERFEYYHDASKKIPFDLDLFNKITLGGIGEGTLNVILAGPHVGKSLALCHFAAAAMAMGKNVLYITLEMAEKEIAKRIDANLLNVRIDEINKLTKQEYKDKVDKLKSKTVGKLKIKEYPTASASTINFVALINDLELKNKFKPDLIVVDYLNICLSARIKIGSNANSYTYVKAIAEELRGFACGLKIPLWTATQTTRSGFNSSDVDITDTSESFGLPATADFMFALVTSEELEANNHIMVKQLKNRYHNVNYYKRFIIGVDRYKMRLYDAEPSAQQGITDSGQPKPPTLPSAQSPFSAAKAAKTNKFKNHNLKV